MSNDNYIENDIAIIGIACRFPGAENPNEFWDNLINGKESIKKLSDAELIEAGVNTEYLENPLYVKASPVLKNPGYFDASFFGFTPGEALALDPQHRILLTCAYEALENAGYDPEKYPGRIGVYTGSALNTYFMNTGLKEKFIDDYIPTLIGNDKDFLSTRLSYKLNLRGPSINVQTACSTSLVAVHLACQSLLNEESDMVMAGAVSVKAPHNAGYIYDSGGIVSPKGHVRAFDAGADGTVFGSGAGIIILKRLAEALKDRDNILAIIKSSAVNNDGSDKAGYTAPGIRSQADVVIEAILNSGVDATEISYIETHGSGTPVGDPIEITALTRAFRRFTDKKNYCAVGSVKTNIGHLDAAAGIAGIIKTILCLKNKKIPASLNYDTSNPEIDFQNSPFYVNSTLREWNSKRKRVAGVMSTGMGGTNAYIILQEAPEAIESKSELPGLIVLSSKSEIALNEQTKNLADYLAANEKTDLNNLAYTLQIGRKEFENRKFLVARNTQEATELLNKNNSKRIYSGRVKNFSKPPVIFLIPGVGDHYIGMGYDLYKNVKVFSDTVDYCSDVLKNYIDTNIINIIYPPDYNRNVTNSSAGIDLKMMLAGRNANDSNALKLNQTINAQSALFIIEYSLAKLWMHFGVIPDAIIGHSMGEYVAACLSGVFSLEDALKIIVKRSELVNNLPKASMLAVTLSEKELLPLLQDDVSVSLINSPNLCVIAGPKEKVDQFKEILNGKGIFHRTVQNSHAFHSKMMSPIFEEFVSEISKIELNPPKIPYTSNVTGNWISEKEALDPEYWGTHLISTARFADSLENAWNIANSILLEVGPGNTLSVLATQHPGRNKNIDSKIFNSLRPEYDNQSDINYLFTSIGKLWLSGININWENLYDEKNAPRRIPLPTYPFKYENFWLKSKSDNVEKTTSKPERPFNDFREWFYTPVWIRKNFGDRKIISFKGNKLWVIFLDEMGLGIQIKRFLEHNKQNVITVKSGSGFYKDINDYVIDYRKPGDYLTLFKELKSVNNEIINIIHLGCYTQRNDSWFDYQDDNIQHLGFYSLLYITQSLSRVNYSIPINIEIVSNHIHQVTGEEILCPKKALVLGICGVIPKEFPGIKCFNVDLITENSNNYDNLEILKNLITEFDSAEIGASIAYRGKFKWIKKYEKIDLEAFTKTEKQLPIKKKGVYLITGGTGGIGLTISKYLGENFQAKLILTQVSEIPEKSIWREIVDKNHIDNLLNQKLRKLIDLEDSGAQVSVFRAPTSDKKKMKEVIEEALKEHGDINGIIHCAGIVKPGIIVAKEKETIKKVLLPKIEGTLVLNDLIKKLNLDFFVLCSSLTSIITPFAESDYSSANAFLDVFAQYSSSQNKIHTLSINWPGWKEVGQLENLKMLTGTEDWKKTALEKAISPQEGLEAFKLALNSNLDQIIVSPVTLETADSFHSIDFHENNIRDKNKFNGENAFDKGVNNIEDKLSLIWKDILGVKVSCGDDNFFESGGHSLLAIQLISAIRKTFRVDLSFEEILDSASFSAICMKIDELISLKNIIQ